MTELKQLAEGAYLGPIDGVKTPGREHQAALKRLEEAEEHASDGLYQLALETLDKPYEGDNETTRCKYMRKRMEFTIKAA